MPVRASLGPLDGPADEDTWRRVLAPAPRWDPPLTRTIVIAPHPDDEVLGSGGLIFHQRRRSAPVQVVAVSDGEAAYPGEAGLAARRIAEQERALARLGVSTDRIVRVGLPDGGILAHADRLAEVVSRLVRADDLLIAPWRHDVHPDHEACGEVAATIAARCGLELASTLFWAWHHVPPAAMPLASIVRLELDDVALAARSRALACHASQLVRGAGGPILPQAVLGPSRRMFEAYVR